MAEIASAAAGAVGALCQAKKALWTPVMDKITFSNDMEEIHTALSDAVIMLGAVRDDFKNAVQRDQIKMSSNAYNQWVRRVSKTEMEVKKLLDKYNQESKSSPIFCFGRRSDFSKAMKKKGEKVVELLEKGSQLEIMAEPPPQPVIKLSAPEIKKFPTLQEPLEQVLELLKKEQVKGILIHGMMGTGKTAIIRNLNNHEEVASAFEIVMYIKVSTEESEENFSMEHLQEALAERLKVKLAGTSSSDDVAQRISSELEGKKYLLLLDDVKCDLDINAMGIRDFESGSKLVLTTRSNYVCRKLVNRVVKVNYLSSKESWRLFQDVVNCPDLEKHPKIAPLAWKIVNECGGHPLLIRTMAGVFKMKDDEKLWREGFNSLKRFSEKEHHGLKEMCRVIKFCYDDLDSAQKKCFLYGALYPEDSDICTDNLLECWEAEDFLGNDNNAREANINGPDILKHLKNKSLLEEGRSDKYVVMHKCIRQVALYIASDDPECKHLVKTNGKMSVAPDAKSWSDKSRISFVGGRFEKLPDSPDCGSLSTLFLQKNLALKLIPALFFAHMKSLKILDLCYTGIAFLPPSVAKLINLKVLYLSYCKYLSKLPSNIEELQYLEVLDIRGSGVNNIPSHIENLKALRRLRVSFFKGRNENGSEEVGFDYNVIPRLSTLEELVIDVKSPDYWSDQVLENIIKCVASLEKLTSLQLCFPDKVVDVIEVVCTALRIHVPEADILQIFLEESNSWRNVEHISSFHFVIGCQDAKYPRIPEFYQYDRYVKYCDGEGKNHPIYKLLANVDAFELVNHNYIKQLSELGIPSASQVRVCLIESCVELETVVDSELLPNLEQLYLKDLPELRNIWNDRVKHTFLKTLVLSNCQVLKNIFPLVVIQQLQEIEYVKIEDCSEIVEIVEKSGTTAGNMEIFPNLKKLILRDLPQLENICANEVSRLPVLEKLKIHNCLALRKLPFSKDDAEKMKLVKAEQQWLDALQW